MNRHQKIARAIWGKLIKAGLDARHVDCDALAETIADAVDEALQSPQATEIDAE